MKLILDLSVTNLLRFIYKRITAIEIIYKILLDLSIMISLVCGVDRQRFVYYNNGQYENYRIETSLIFIHSDLIAFIQ